MDVLKQTEAMFYALGRMLYEWQRVEAALFRLYVVRTQQQSDYRLLATTFHHIRSFDTKLGLVDTTLSHRMGEALHKRWRTELRNPLGEASKERNNIVHGEMHHLENGDAVIVPFITDMKRYDDDEGPDYAYDTERVRTIAIGWATLAFQMSGFREEIDPSPVVQATRKGRLLREQGHPSDSPSPTEKK